MSVQKLDTEAIYDDELLTMCRLADEIYLRAGQPDVEPTLAESCYMTMMVRLRLWTPKGAASGQA